MALQIFGIPVSRGVAVGRAVLMSSARLDVAHYFVDAGDEEREVDRLRAARQAVRAELDALQAELPADAPPELSAFIDVHKMLLDDPQIGRETASWIRKRRYNAEWALTAQLEVVGRSFDDMEDAYLRERKADVEQVVERLLRALRGTGGLARGMESEEDLVLVAHDIAPADMMQFKQGVFSGFATDVGGKTSHTAIVARSLDIPAVVGAREASRLIRQDDWVIIDGDSGLLIVDPSPIILEDYRVRKQESELGRERLKRLKNTPARTLDGQMVELLANIELPDDCESALDAGAAGIGLFRTEFLFMNRAHHLPGEDEQFEAYRRVVQGMGGRPVTIRTIDIGADKPLDAVDDYRDGEFTHLNPALGLRAIRYSLSDPAMFRVQLRALLRAARYGTLRILIPMLAHAGEIRQTFALLDTARAELAAAGQAYGPAEIGAMIEVPGAVLMLPLFLKYFDFVSVGTNDLVQYTLAIDRADESVAALYDPLHPAVLQLLAQTIAQSHAAEAWKGRPVHVSVCGEMAGDPSLTRLLLGLGLRSFSMHPAQILSVKQEILRADCARLAPLAQAVLAEYEPEGQLRALAALTA
ncbi:MAG: phosphoenolpyruvate--protein phosphotransferase [Betaproteobacteria bacterium]|jgi:phosphotransferase system enzyme I (PtsI)|uniref:Phosphoenolpyruvate-protein phosphotransferase n=1 Tax=Thiomonas delicata TaxID=364030 RepID=A0A238CZL8_THIDL|nr:MULTISPECIES: phosphoenolpyruvate--protein phosphotransferase [Thiomonas]MDE2130662.1 phosphoenolpyruvate--protein phosphotransferase [Betaproteobacteria bacterium]OZB43918.1 MAG: phosphoenolpyruvate--protein phosphotransferase [Thiomonas sp. 15-66-11]OZB62710.1 MAG: phosphoenolpyruvate--protein phosphotransferase [Thiomonas sp. 13-66-29]SBP86443.1 Phosphoenolpyruvate-protein phosphotransferase [Thiomonas delicata]